MLKHLLVPLALVFCIFFNNGFAQNIVQTRQYPQKYFRYPLDLPPSTAGSFGELRPNHFHSGLDFKTNNQTGYPVHAVADGYISRLRIQFGGFGHAIYITHPNGYTTVYGHIKTFSPAMEKAIRDTQYKKQSYEVDFKLDPKDIPVCQGDVIAMSGNEGASEGPHLHFEIRDTKTEETINAQLFGLTIPDRVSPAIYAVGIYHLDGEPFGEKTPRQFLAVGGKNGNYHLLKPGIINLSGSIGFGITTNDMNSTSQNHNGIYSCEVKLDGKTVYTFAVERFGFDQTHAINAYIDYPEFLKTHRWMQKCFILPGSKISLYPQSVNRGIINFNDDAVHEVEYVVKDVAGNISSLTIKVKSSHKENLPVIKAPADLFKYDRRNEFNEARVKVIVMPGNLYDDVNFTFASMPRRPGAISPTYSILNRYTPIHDSYELWIKPDSGLQRHLDKAVIVSTAGVPCEGNVYQDGYVKAQPHSFGDFYVRVDTVPPVILPINIRPGVSLAKAHTISLRMGDNLSGIKSYAGKIDGRWVLMVWDFKSRILSYTFAGDITSGKHSFELTVTDNKDNVAHFSADFYR